MEEELTAEQKQMSKIWDYEFSAVNYTDYELVITLFTLNRILKKVFERASKSRVLSQKFGAKVRELEPKQIDETNEIIVSPQYYKLVNVGSRKILGIVQDIILKDGVYMLNHDIEEIRFIRNVENKLIWEMHIKYIGQYRKQ